MELNLSVMAFVVPKRKKEGESIEDKKVDDKPMVIHTKEKAKIHTHNPKQANQLCRQI